MIAEKIPLAEIQGMDSFASVRKNIAENTIGVLPIENSYAGSIHENFRKFLEYDYKIIGEIELKVNHCLLSKETDISKIKKAYSHPQALAQCQNFLKEHNIEPVMYNDTAESAKFVAESDEPGLASIASAMAGQIYHLNILESHIHDQENNTTRFFVVAKNEIDLPMLPKNKTTILFETQNKP
jgi:prephenate dehydratase